MISRGLLVRTSRLHVPRELAKHALTLLGSMPDMEMLGIEAEKLPA